MKPKVFRRMDSQVAVLLIAMLFLSNFCIFFVCYHMSYQSMVQSLSERVNNIWEYLDSVISPLDFDEINGREDMTNPVYVETKEALESVRRISNLRYVYTAKRGDDGVLVYVVDGLPESAGDDFRYPGDPIEEEICGELEKALGDKVVMPSKILKTDWGKIFIAYCPVHDSNGQVMGALGIEISAETEYDAFFHMRIFALIFCALLCVVSAGVSLLVFRRISNPHFHDLANTDILTGLKNRNAYLTDIHNLEARKLCENYAVIVVDLNNLKGVNDGFGHDAGDIYLTKATRAICGIENERIVAYRYGGDEFVILLREAEESLEAYEEKITQNFLVYQKDFSVPVSLALGSAKFDAAQDMSLADTQRRADRKMYENKRKQKSVSES